MAPIKTFQVRTNYAPWLSPELRTKMKERGLLHQQASETGIPDDWKKFRKVKNQV